MQRLPAWSQRRQTSLELIKSIPCNELKVEGNITRKIVLDDGARKLCLHTTNLAKDLGIWKLCGWFYILHCLNISAKNLFAVNCSVTFSVEAGKQRR